MCVCACVCLRESECVLACVCVWIAKPAEPAYVRKKERDKRDLFKSKQASCVRIREDLVLVRVQYVGGVLGTNLSMCGIAYNLSSSTPTSTDW